MNALDDLCLSLVLASLPLVDLVIAGRCSRGLCEAVQGAREAWRRLADELPSLHAQPNDKQSGDATTTAATATPTPERLSVEREPGETADPSWSTRTLPPPAAAGAAHARGRWRPPPPCAEAQDCRLRLLSRRRAARARRALDLLRRQSDAASAERAVRALTLELAAEAHNRGRVAREAAAIAEDLRAAGPPAGGGGGGVRAWVPSGVRAGWDAAGAGVGAAPSHAAGGGGPPSLVAVRGVDARVRLRQLAQEAAVSDARAETLGMSLRAARQSMARARRALEEATGAEARSRGAGEGDAWGGGGGDGRAAGAGVVRVCPTPLLL